VRINASWAVVAAALLGLSACGGGGGGDIAPPQQFTTQILSDPVNDGDIEQTSPGAYVVTQGMSPTVQSTFVGIDPNAGTEFRTFLDFPLSGAGGVPGDAIIDTAFLEFYVNDIEPPNGTVPIRVDLVSFQPPDLIGTDFDRNIQPALASALVQGDVNSADVGNFVSVDVTPLMIRAQQLGLVDFQVRILEDLGPAVLTLVEINDSTAADRHSRGPLLTVTFH
jgi:hypothetical protein